MKSAGKARSNGLYRHIRTSKEIIRNLLNDSAKNFEEFIKFSLHFIDTSKLRKVCLYTDFFRYYTKMSEAERGESYVGKGVDSGGKSAYGAGR